MNFVVILIDAVVILLNRHNSQSSVILSKASGLSATLTCAKHIK